LLLLLLLVLLLLRLHLLLRPPASLTVICTAHAVAARYVPASTVNVEENVVCCQWSSIHVVFGFVYGLLKSKALHGMMWSMCHMPLFFHAYGPEILYKVVHDCPNLSRKETTHVGEYVIGRHRTSVSE
jgi:hypothetical protein